MSCIGAADAAAVQHQRHLLSGADDTAEQPVACRVRGQLPLLVERGAEAAVLFFAARIDLEDRDRARQREHERAGAALLVAKREGRAALLPRNSELIVLVRVRDPLDALVSLAEPQLRSFGEAELF